MKTIKNLLWSLLPVLCMAFVVSCTPPESQTDEPNGPQVTKDSTIKLNKTKVDAAVAGGDYTMIYEIENAHAGEKITVEAAESWVNNFDTAISGILKFSVDSNPGSEERQCLVTVKYRYAEDAVFVVKQSAMMSAGFTIKTVSTDYFSYTVEVTPDDLTKPYIVMSADPMYIAASGFKTGEDFYEDDIAYFAFLGQFYGMSAAQVVAERATIGKETFTPGKGAAGIPYTFYCYYVDTETGALLSDVAFHEVYTKSPEKIAADFTVEYEVEGCVVTADVTPNGYEGAYYFDMLNGLMVDDYLETFDFLKDEGDAAEFYWSFAVQDMMFNGNMSGQTIRDYYNCQGEYEDGTSRSHYEFELLAEHTYYLFAFAMDENGLCCSEPKIVKIETGSVPMSENVITPSVSKVTAQTAHIEFKTTNNDYYIAGWEKASDWATYGNTDAERQQYLLTNLSYEFIQGDYEQDIIGLEQGVEYVLYAFGSRGGIATTEQIWTCSFTTKSGIGAATIDFVDYGYFVASDLAEIPGCEFFGGDYYSGKLIIPLEFRIEGEWQAFFSVIYTWTGRRYEEYNEKQYLDGLVWHINEYGSMNTEKSYSVLDVAAEYTQVAMVIDKDGVYSKIAKRMIDTSYEGANTDISVFEAFWDSMQNGSDGPGLSAKTLFAKKLVKDNKVSEKGEIASVRMEIME